MITEEQVSIAVAKKLLEIKAVFLQPNDMFTWASGIKSPIYCDNRVTLSYPKIRMLIKESFVKLIKEKFPETNCIAGVATAGIPHAALIADAMKLPMIYIRSSSKDHGRTNQIEGKIPDNAKITVIEDLISTGGSSLKAIDALKDTDADVQGLAAIFTYNLPKAKANLDNYEFKGSKGMDYYTLSNYETLIQAALEGKYVSEEELTILKNWHSDLSV